eukprot:scaffold301_cov150-Amphora_coffeaeformis.AAC.2
MEGVASLTWKQPNPDVCVSVRNPLDHGEVRERVVIDTSALETPPAASGRDDHHTAYAHAKPTHGKHPKHPEAPCHFALKWAHATERSTIRVIFPSSTSTSLGESNEDDNDKSADKKSHDKKKHNKMIPALANALTDDDDDKAVPMLALECKNVEPYALHLLGTEFVVTDLAGKKFSDALEWQEDHEGAGGGPVHTWQTYDLATGRCSIVNLKGTFA